ncbi:MULTISPECIES: hypothetical protein [Micromonospora]|uniref:hypothetical protein n=1 Tax=Micromonospora TaxID=1873 RepID=UPI0011D2B465|nr:hypothetical protein [Micromonospora maris]
MSEYRAVLDRPKWRVTVRAGLGPTSDFIGVQTLVGVPGKRRRPIQDLGWLSSPGFAGELVSRFPGMR